MAAVANCTRRLVSWRPATAAAAAAAATAKATVLVLPMRRPIGGAGEVATAASSAAAAAAVVGAVGAARPFSTTPWSCAKGGAQHVRGGKQVQMRKKKKAPPRGKTAEPGERRALRKRIVLSNSNALEVPDLEELTASHLTSSTSTGTGRVLALPDAVVDQLRAVEAFKPSQCFPLFRRPSLLVRSETAALAAQMQQAAAAGETLRLVVDGERIAGKSILLLQALAHGFMNDWVVVHIPEAQELTSASTEYAALADTEPTQYVQPAYVLRLLQAIHASSGRVLAQHKTVRAYERLQNPVPAGSTLLQLVAAARENDHAWPVFQALWWELTTPTAESGTLPDGKARPPLLLSLDGLAHVMRTSAYRSPAFEPIHAHDLALVRTFADVLGGATPLPHGGAVLAATSRSNAPTNPTLDLVLARRLAEQDAKDAKDAKEDSAAKKDADPFFRGYDERVAAVLQTVRVLRLQGVSRDEARSLMEYWAASGVLRDRVDEQAVAGTWSLAGNGVVGEMERTTLLSLRP